MFPLYNIVFDIIASVVVCVDFLGTHMASLVLFFETGCDSRQGVHHLPFSLTVI